MRMENLQASERSWRQARWYLTACILSLIHISALCELVIEGVETNLEEQLALVNEPEFADGSYDLRFMESR